MSTQSIIHKTIEDLANDADKVYIEMAKAYLMKVRFGVGNSYDQDDFLRICWLDRVLCEENCELKDFVKKSKQQLNLITIKYL